MSRTWMAAISIALPWSSRRLGYSWNQKYGEEPYIDPNPTVYDVAEAFLDDVIEEVIFPRILNSSLLAAILLFLKEASILCVFRKRNGYDHGLILLLCDVCHLLGDPWSLRLSFP